MVLLHINAKNHGWKEFPVFHSHSLAVYVTSCACVKAFTNTYATVPPANGVERVVKPTNNAIRLPSVLSKIRGHHYEGIVWTGLVQKAAVR